MEVKILGVPRSMIVAGLEGLTLLLMFRQGVLTSLSLALAAGKLLLLRRSNGAASKRL